MTWFGHERRGLVEPPRREAGEHAALVGDLVGQHDVEHRDPVARDHEQPVVRRPRRARAPCRCRCASASTSLMRGSSLRADRWASRAAKTRSMFASARSRSKQAASALSSSTAATSGSSASRSWNERRSSHAFIALRCTIRYAASRLMPLSTSASSTGWLNTSPYEASRFSSMRAGDTVMPCTTFVNVVTT